MGFHKWDLRKLWPKSKIMNVLEKKSKKECRKINTNIPGDK